MLTAPEMQSLQMPGSKSTKAFSLTAADLRTYLSRLNVVGVPSDIGDYPEAKQHLDDILAAGGVFAAAWQDRNCASAWMMPFGRDLASVKMLSN